MAAILACAIGATAYGEQTDTEKKKAEEAAAYLKAHGWAVQKPGEAKKKTTADSKAVAATPAPHYGAKADQNFFERLNGSFWEQLGQPGCTLPWPAESAPTSKDGKADVPPAPATRRAGPVPFDSPPWFNPEWQIGGGPNIIGDPGSFRDSPYPLMQALQDGPWGEAWYNSRIQIYGWVTAGGNLSTSRNNTVPNNAFPQVYDDRSNQILNDQDVLYVERLADMNQQDHWDWGFRWTFLYGHDYRFMASRGMLNDHNLFVANKQSGFDMPMMYFNLYVPKVFEGLNIIVGRIISMPDIEQQLAPQNPMASHSLVYSFDDYTDWGIWGTVKLNKNWTYQLGLSDGVDIAPWAHNLHDPGCQPTGSSHIQWVNTAQTDSFYVGMNSFNNGRFGFNNLQECIESYAHKFNDKCWTTFEYQYMFTNGCTTGPTAKVPIEDGFYPVKAGRAFGTGLVNYTMYRFACNAYFTVRNEGWDDPHGYRSGYGSWYSEHAIGITWFPDKLIMIRPEIRFDHAYTRNGLASSSAEYNTTGAPEHVVGPFDSGTRQSQLTFACDVTIRF